jgi:hypothetical protein
MNSCKTQKPQTRVVYKFVKDSTHIQTTRNVVLPVKHVTVLESPCKNDTLVIPTQIVKNEKGSLKISSENGKLVVEATLDSISDVHVDQFRGNKELEIREVEVFVDKPVRDRWYWSFLIYSVLASVWILKKPIMWLIRKFIIPLPI